MTTAAKGGLPGDVQGMLSRFLWETACGARLKLPGQFPPQILDMQYRGVFTKQLTMCLLQIGNAEAHQSFNSSVVLQ